MNKKPTQKEIERRQKISLKRKEQEQEKKALAALRAAGHSEEEAKSIVKIGIRDSHLNAYVDHTASRIAAMQRSGETGRLKEWMEFAHDLILKDPHLSNTIQIRKNSLASKSLGFQPTRDDDFHRACSQFVEYQVAQIPSVEMALMHLLDATYVGLSAVEVVFSYDEEANLYFVSQLVPIPGKLLSYDAELQVIIHNPNQPEIDGKRLRDLPGYFIIHEPKQITTFSNIDGLLRVAAWPAFFKRQGLKYWSSGAERFAFPAVYATAPADTAPNVMQALLDNLSRLTNEGITVVKTGVSIQPMAQGTAGGDSVWMQFCKYMDYQISKLILGGTLTSDPGNNGSYAQAEVHERAEQKLVISDAKRLAATLKRDLVSLILEMNAHLFDQKPVLPDVYFEGVEEFPKIEQKHIDAGVIRVNELRREITLPLLSAAEGGNKFIPGKLDLNAQSAPIQPTEEPS
jgi:phage gp29-like protein